MRKEWVKRENIYFKPFYKQKSKMMLLFLLLLTILIYFYIGNYVNNLPVTSTPYLNISTFIKETNSFTTSSKLSKFAKDDSEIKIIRGTRLRDYNSYKLNLDKKFHCLDNSKSMPYRYLNDDYCDCKDGSDEPSTNACANGKFYCKYQKRHLTGRGRDVYVKSSLINDEVCDCCDGSDEWETPIKCVNYCI